MDPLVALQVMIPVERLGANVALEWPLMSACGSARPVKSFSAKDSWKVMVADLVRVGIMRMQRVVAVEKWSAAAAHESAARTTARTAAATAIRHTRIRHECHLATGRHQWTGKTGRVGRCRAWVTIWRIATASAAVS